jgi:hypothetical protein
LVSGGALKLIRFWLDVSADILAHVGSVILSRPAAGTTTDQQHHFQSSPVLSCSNSLDDSDYINHNLQHSPRRNAVPQAMAIYEQFVKVYGRAYELMTNAAASLMYLSGGSDGRYATAHTDVRDSQSGGGIDKSGSAYDYSVGWIDGLFAFLILICFHKKSNFQISIVFLFLTAQILAEGLCFEF